MSFVSAKQQQKGNRCVDNSIILKLAATNPNNSGIDRLVNIYHMLSQVLVFDVAGAIVELGCNSGKTSVFLRFVLNHYSSQRELHVYDSFLGLPEKGTYDTHASESALNAARKKFEEDARKSGINVSYGTSLTKGGFKATKLQLEENFQKLELNLPFIHEGWFEDTLPHCLPNQIAFAYLDGDFYNSILISLRYIYPRLTKRAIVVIDDYCDPEKSPHAWHGLPGVKKACDDFLIDKPDQVYVLIGSDDLAMGYLRKL